MSKDFIVFDLSDVDPTPSKERLLEYVNLSVGEGKKCSIDLATENIKQILDWATQRYGSTVDADSLWASWPPTLLAEGLHCTFNLCPSADSMSFMMDLCDQCKGFGLLMIDPSGRNPFITIPGGGGLLD